MKPTLLVLAAGMGSRYGGVKQIDAVGMHNETLLDFGVYDAAHSGYGRVVFIIRKDIEKDFRERLFDRIARNMDADYVFQSLDSLLTSEQLKMATDRKKPWGTIHALLCAKDAVKTPFTVINADDYYGRTAYQDLGAYLSTLDNDSTAHAMVGYVLENTMSRSGSVSRGVCKVKDGYQLNLPHDINHIYISAWKADVGQMLVRDLRRYQGDNVYELTTRSEKALLRKIPADELEEMEDKKFNHLQIGDCMFTVLKAIPVDAYYCWYNDAEADPDETVSIEPANTISQEDIQYGDSADGMSDSESIESAALF